ncbi:YqaA family protein [Microvirga sp. Mcv34]|uniref:YqaA family protein n=1 Tax=Microvirga sp. Mcv34 TaxID=2926016 RepID=UPI0021C605F4|nr:YqaA family protein [Microvirga sp. Mcv34]
MNHVLEYGGLLLAAFLSATVLPFQSEVVLFGLLITEHYQWWLLILVASVGNTLGSAVNWLVGRLLSRFEGRPWFPVKRETIERAEHWYHRYGRWSLLLSWLPFIGDPLTIVAGVLREPFLIFVAIVAVAKTARYFAVAAMTFGWF